MIEMNRRSRCSAVFLLFGAVLNVEQHAKAQVTPPPTKLSVHWEELTGPDFIEANNRAQGTCLLPFGIMEKHGPHMPLGTNLINVRYAALHAAKN
jgi:creatinine amidohydrolase